MKSNRIVWGVILVILIVAAIAYLGTTRNMSSSIQPQSNTQNAEEKNH
ncbi:hypothetical protein SAMN05421890_0285 [Ensifer adhaerens]|nr:hypothetical protein SAMN05421890_0285 [Ensifer adhaerens]